MIRKEDITQTTTLSTNQDLARFRPAHSAIFQRALLEVKQSRKQSHWMWCIFPQLRGLGHSYRANYYGIEDLSEAQAYLQDSELGGHLVQITQALMSQPEDDVRLIFAHPDDLKLRSCLTLFRQAAIDENTKHLFQAALNRFFAGTPDEITLTRLAK